MTSAPELLLAAGEVVVERAERSVGRGHDLLQAGARVAVAAEQLSGGVKYPISLVSRSLLLLAFALLRDLAAVYHSLERSI